MWGWLGNNAVGLIQIGLAIIALIYAFKAYRKVLHQIKVSDKQTDLTIDQMTRYNNERLFEIGIRVKESILNQTGELKNLQREFTYVELQYAKLSKKLKFERIDEDYELLNDKEASQLSRQYLKDKLSENRQIVFERIKYLDELYLIVNDVDDYKKLEFIMNEIYSFNKVQDDLKHDTVGLKTNLKNLETVLSNL